jgi:predicted ATP-grasp superfamily ATP-dependent carboligase
MATLMRCTTPHWQGNTFVDAGTIFPAGHGQVVPAFFEVYEIEETPDPEAELDALRAVAEAAGVKVDKRWKADRLREEIADAGGA